MTSLQLGINGLYHCQDELKMNSWLVHLEQTIAVDIFEDGGRAVRHPLRFNDELHTPCFKLAGRLRIASQSSTHKRSLYITLGSASIWLV